MIRSGAASEELANAQLSLQARNIISGACGDAI